jgi:hypothetical protein
MTTKVKIKIVNNGELRAKIDEIYEIANQIVLVKWH